MASSSSSRRGFMVGAAVCLLVAIAGGVLLLSNNSGSDDHAPAKRWQFRGENLESELASTGYIVKYRKIDVPSGRGVLKALAGVATTADGKGSMNFSVVVFDVNQPYPNSDYLWKPIVRNQVEGTTIGNIGFQASQCDNGCDAILAFESTLERLTRTHGV